MAKPNKNSPRRSSRKKKQTETSTSEINCDSDKRDGQKLSIQISLRRRKDNSRSSSIDNLHKREKNLPSLTELEKMFDDSSSDDDTTAIRKNKNISKQLPSNEGTTTVTISPTQTSQNYDEIETVNNINNHSPIEGNQSTYKINLTVRNNAASYLEQLENECSDDSSCSTKTVTYDYNTWQNKTNTFSPLPSTSRDNETIMQNEILFNESMVLDTSHGNNNETMVTRTDNDNVTSTSAQDNAVHDTYETITIEDVEPETEMHIDDSIVIDLDNISESNVIYDETINLPKSNKKPIIIDTTKYINSNTEKTLIYVRHKDAHASTSSANNNSTYSRNNVTTQSGNNADSETDNNSSDYSIDDIVSAAQSLRKESNNRGSSTGDYRPPLKYVAYPKLDLKIMSWKMKKREWNQLKNVLKTKKQKLQAMRQNGEVQSSSEDLGNGSNVESDRNRENENISHRDFSDPMNLGVCPICMEPLNKDIASTLCGHLFCMRCIKSALQITGKKCPTCRKSLKGVGYHQIFI